jgi:hypothetical protein
LQPLHHDPGSYPFTCDPLDSMGKRRTLSWNSRGWNRLMERMESQVTRLRLGESAMVSRFVFSRKIGRPAISEFCNRFEGKADLHQAVVNRRE